MLLYIIGALLLALFFYVLYKVLTSRYHSHWQSWVGVGWIVDYNFATKKVTIPTYFLNSPAGRSNIKRGSIVLARNGEDIPNFESKEDFIPWVRSLKREVGKVVTYKLLEPISNDVWEEREVTLRYEKLRGTIPVYAPLPTSEDMHQDWKRLTPNFKAAYLMDRCPRTGVRYHRVRIIPVGDF